MNIIIKLLIAFFNIIDELYHQKRIENFLKKEKIELFNFGDIGAFEGKYSELFLRINPNCKGFLFEPQKKYFNFLKKKFEKNNNIEIFNFGISNLEKPQYLNINKHEITSTLSSFNQKNIYLNFKAFLFRENLEKMTTSREEVELKSFFNFSVKEKINSLSLLKVDTEGHEYEVLIGLQDFIKKINYILIEFHNDSIYQNYNSQKIHNFLLEKNFLLKKRFKFPFTTWEDRIYVNKTFS